MRTKISIIIWLLAVVVPVFLLDSCEKVDRHQEGNAVRFTVGSDGTDTKAVYSGVSNSGKTIERIDWQVGDLLRIYCAQVSEPSAKYADYKVSTVNSPSAQSEISTGKIELASPETDDIGLRWGSGEHTFYGVFPSPYVTGGAVTGIEGKTVSASIPATQGVTGSISKSGTSWKAAPDMKNMVMTAKAGPYEEDNFVGEDEVFISFTALTTAIEFTITNDTGADLPLTSVQLISGNGKTTAEPVIKGTFSVNLDQTGIAAGTEVQLTAGSSFKIKYLRDYPKCSATSPTSTNMADRTLSINVGTSATPLILEEDETFTFTFFLNPIHHFDDLTFKFVRADGSWMSTRLGYANGDGVFFPRHKKSFVRGLLIPDGAQWTVKYGPTVENWGDGTGSGGGIDPMPPVDEALTLVTSWDSGIDGNLLLRPMDYKFKLANATDERKSFGNSTESADAAIAVNSYFEKDDGGNEAVGWIIESVKVGSAAAQSVGAASFSNIGGLSAVKDGNNLKITAAKRTESTPGTNSYWTGSNGGWSPESWSGTKATSTAPLDLSKFDFRTETVNNKMTTANCYIVRHAGTYKIPLVYGNAIVGGQFNEQAYYPNVKGDVTNGNSTSNYRLVKFKNHLGRDISSPFIEYNTNSSGNMLAPSSGTSGYEIVWQDRASIITINGIQKEKVKVKNSSGVEQEYNISYLIFTIPQDKICQNNAILAVKDATGIMWSWHIWTTNDPALLSAPVPITNYSDKEYDMFPIYMLGRIDGKQYPSREQAIITLVQDESGNKIEIIVEQPIVPGDASNGTWYQFGRKDPMCPVDDPVSGTFLSPTDQASLAESIQHPGSFYCDFNNWCESLYHNLWTGKLNATGDSGKVDQSSDMIKTIYDPSPVGYKVPASKVYTGFTSDGTNQSSFDKFNVKEENYTDFVIGWTFYSCKKASVTASTPTVFFPAAGYRQDSNKSISSIGQVGRFWSANSYNDKDGYCLYFHRNNNLDSESVQPVQHNYRSYGFSVRPVTE